MYVRQYHVCGRWSPQLISEFFSVRMPHGSRTVGGEGGAPKKEATQQQNGAATTTTTNGRDAEWECMQRTENRCVYGGWYRTYAEVRRYVRTTGTGQRQQQRTRERTLPVARQRTDAHRRRSKSCQESRILSARVHSSSSKQAQSAAQRDVESRLRHWLVSVSGFGT